MPSQSRSEGTYMAGKVTVIDTDDVTPEVRALLADRDRWKKRTAGWCEMWSAAESANATLAAKLVEAQANRDEYKRCHDEILEEYKAAEAEVSALRCQLAEARGAMQADAERLLAATQRVGMPPAGCDTADWLAEEVLTLRGKLAEACEAMGYAAVFLENGYIPTLELWNTDDWVRLTRWQKNEAVAAAIRSLLEEIRR